MVVAFLAQPAGRSHSLYTHLPLFRSHSPPQRCPSSPTFRTPRGRLRTAQLMNSIAGTGTSPFRPPGRNTLYIHLSLFRSHSPPQRCPSSPTFRTPRGRLRTTQLMNSIAGTGTSPLRPPGRNTLYIHLSLCRPHSPPQRCPSSPTFTTPRSRHRTAQLMNSIAGTGTSPFRPPGRNTLYIHLSLFRSHSPPQR